MISVPDWAQNLPGLLHPVSLGERFLQGELQLSPPLEPLIVTFPSHNVFHLRTPTSGPHCVSVACSQVFP
jgi:hypothetical protein